LNPESNNSVPTSKKHHVSITKLNNDGLKPSGNQMLQHLLGKRLRTLATDDVWWRFEKKY